MERLWSVNGCASSSIEVMMNYYKELARRRQVDISKLKKRVNKLTAEEIAAVAAASAYAASTAATSSGNGTQRNIGSSAFMKILDEELSKE